MCGDICTGGDGVGFIELDAERGDAGYECAEKIEDQGVGPTGHAPGGGAEGGAAADDVQQPERQGRALPGGFTGRTRRKKMVAVPYEGGVLTGAYISALVKDARTCTFAGHYSEGNWAIAQSYLKRQMVQHGVRPQHIHDMLGKMTLAVFYRSDDDIAIERGRNALQAVKRTRCASSGGFW